MWLQWSWWQVDFVDFMLVTIFGCWWQNFDIGDIFWMLMLKDRGCWGQNRLKPSPTSQNCRQHPSLTSMQPFDVFDIKLILKLFASNCKLITSKITNLATVKLRTRWWLFNRDIGSIIIIWVTLSIGWIGHQHLTVLLNISRHQDPSPTSLKAKRC